MTDIMSYQYPAPPASGGSTTHMALSPAGYHVSMAAADYANGLPQTSSSSGLGQEPHSSPRERRDSLSKSSTVNMKLKRSVSTPVVAPQQAQDANMSMAQQQGLSQPDHAAISLAAEKRRNKLGYHRTSVACGHCRRRKIRCIPSPADIQGRCVNCIRLKKECSFYPVDQQPPPDTRKNSTSRSSVGHHHHHLSSAAASAASASGSAPLMPAPTQLPLPSLANLPNPDPRGRPQQNTQPLTMPSIQTMAPPSMKPSGGEPFSPDPKLSGRQSFDYSHGGMTNWMSADASPSSSKPGDLNASWRSYPQESPITPAFSPYTTHAAPPSATWTSDATGRGGDDLGWSYPPPPPRSLSFGSDTMGSHHGQHQQQSYPSISQMTSGHHSHSSNGGHRSSSSSYDRKSSAAAAAAMSDLYQSPTTIPGVDSIPGTTLDHHVSLSAGAVGTTAYANWQQPYSYSKDGSDAYVGWGDHSGTPASEGHAATSMYYTGR
ncbi:hypothetical protein HMPREF1624_06130 [Sporothrix schenckii ATCC 58251]|uniref:Zn(2)-C6 fungal-type domain-containing protein n=1 Tax=Sporothrix schenckii (strain ATCC 58251 / de Perez 2211183) TaxID=1391915 RepID=U7PQQ1_SPOS1|nr:hypothetical protein HMPREF1624_06130 [Sporothrix schenckii ATCC 58251]